MIRPGRKLAELAQGFDDAPARAAAVVQLLLVANGIPAFVILMTIPGRTEHWFVWTVTPPANARVLGVMYANALLLACIGLVEREWARIRITFVVITLFSLAATTATFFTLDPFLKHSWLHFAYWLTMYFVLCAASPIAFFLNERARGGRLPVDHRLPRSVRALTALMACLLGFAGLGLLFAFPDMKSLWPFELTPLVAHVLGVWFTSLAAAHIWALWDADQRRTRPIFLQAVPTGILLALIPLLDREQLRDNAGGALAAYLTVAFAMVAVAVLVLMREGYTSPREAPAELA